MDLIGGLRQAAMSCVKVSDLPSFRLLNQLCTEGTTGHFIYFICAIKTCTCTYTFTYIYLVLSYCSFCTRQFFKFFYFTLILFLYFSYLYHYHKACFYLYFILCALSTLLQRSVNLPIGTNKGISDLILHALSRHVLLCWIYTKYLIRCK